jgi:hypothetical protein
MSLPGQGPEMVLIEGGTFLVGSPEGDDEAADDERPAHQVTLRPFALARCETSVGEFRRFVEETGYETMAERAGGCYTVNGAGDGLEEHAGARWDAPAACRPMTFRWSVSPSTMPWPMRAGSVPAPARPTGCGGRRDAGPPDFPRDTAPAVSRISWRSAPCPRPWQVRSAIRRVVAALRPGSLDGPRRRAPAHG